MSISIIQGDSNPIPITLYAKGSTLYPLPGTATVEVAVRDDDTLLTSILAITDTDPGNDWPNSVIGYKPDEAETKLLVPQNNAMIQIKVDDSGDIQNFLVTGVKILKGLIP